jgi:membrane-bound lytic murein transglycosylase B
MKRIRIGYILMLAVCLAACSSLQSRSAAQGTPHFKTLQQRLIADGFSENRIRELYAKPSVSFDVKSVSQYFVHKESTLNYDQFTEPGQIQNAKAYMETYKKEMIAAEQAYGVSRRVITAILLVETRLGTYLGKRSVFNTLSTMAALADKDVRKMLWGQISDTTNFSKEEFEAKADKKSGWAYDELKALLKYADREKSDPTEFVGSYAGAMGICQFMPSNALTLAKDGNDDGKVDLFNAADAIMSVASYLNNYGWYSGIDEKGAYDAVYHYNHSSYYVKTILKVAQMLKG